MAQKKVQFDRKRLITNSKLPNLKKMRIIGFSLLFFCFVAKANPISDVVSSDSPTYVPPPTTPPPPTSFADPKAISSVWRRRNLKNVQLTDKRLKEGVIFKSNFRNVTFDGSNLNGMQMNDSSVFDSSFHRVKMKGLRCRNSTVENSNLSSADLKQSYFYNCRFNNVNLKGADLSESIVIKSSFKDSTFDEKTKLPWNQDEAISRGMIFEAGSTE